MNKIVLKNISSKPGIYKMLDKDDKIIYIGKAANLKKRVASYFSKKSTTIKTHKLVKKISNIEVIITNNEKEALLLENTLIKKHKPRYNILLRDDKSYPYIFIDTDHSYPLIKFYRGSKNLKGTYFGPYSQVGSLRKTLNIVQKIFKVRQCENSYFRSRKKPCLQYQIKRCTAPCMNLITKKNYKESVENSILFLQGKTNPIIKSYLEKMSSLSHQRRYEEASQIRDKISIIRDIVQSKNIIFEEGNIDIITISKIENEAYIDVFMIRDGINLGNNPFTFKNQESISKELLFDSFIKQYYLKNVPPEKILLSDKTSDCEILEKILGERYGKNIKIIKSNKKIYSSYLKVCQENTNNRAKQMYLLISTNNIFKSLSNDLDSKVSIKNIICFDVSHISGGSMVGSSVWYEKGEPTKRLYRKYNLDHISKADDYQAINFIVKKRLSSLVKENNLPELILIDGGKGQISEVKRVMKDLSINSIIILGIKKGIRRHSHNDKILNSENKDITILLQKDSLQMLQIIRNEAHRFAITAQRKKSIKRLYDSKLDKIPGIGEKRKYQLLQYFGGIQSVLKSSIDELENVPGINRSLAEKIFYYLKK